MSSVHCKLLPNLLRWVSAGQGKLDVKILYPYLRSISLSDRKSNNKKILFFIIFIILNITIWEYQLFTNVTNFSCDPRGEASPCTSVGQCNCKQNVEGQSCDRCRPGTFGLSESNPLGCHSCYCSGVTNDCHEVSNVFIKYIMIKIAHENFLKK